MLSKLICLNRDGVTLTAEEIAELPRYAGNLIIEDWHQGGTFGRAVRRARLLDMTIPQAPRDLLAPLFEPPLVRMTNTQMTLHGYQIHADAATAVHYAQCWALRQIETSNS